MIIFHKELHLEDNICGRINAVSINIFYKTYKSTKSPIVFAEPSCKCLEKSDVSQQRHNADHNSH